MAEICNVTVGGELKQYNEGISYTEIAKDFQDQYDSPIVLVLKNGKLTELFKKVTSDCRIEFLY